MPIFYPILSTIIKTSYVLSCGLFVCFANAEFYKTDYNSPIWIAEHEFSAEIADTPEKRSVGMMYRPRMNTNESMLFVFPTAQRLSFWMKNTLIPLDILFFNAQGELLEIKPNIPPCKTWYCKSYPSHSADVKFVVELKAGEVKRRSISVGSKLYGCGF